MATTPGEVLADGWSLVIFPEGTRSKDGWMGNFRMGAAFLAHEHGVPVVPVAHRGTFAAMPRGQGWPSPGRRQLTIRFGEPLRARHEGESVREFAPRIKDAVAALLDEDRTTWWEARRRAAAGAHPGPVAARRSPSGAGSGSSPSPPTPTYPPAGSAPGPAPPLTRDFWSPRFALTRDFVSPNSR